MTSLFQGHTQGTCQTGKWLQPPSHSLVGHSTLRNHPHFDEIDLELQRFQREKMDLS